MSALEKELAKAIHDIPYYRRLGGHAYKQHMAHIKNLERKVRNEISRKAKPDRT